MNHLPCSCAHLTTRLGQPWYRPGPQTLPCHLSTNKTLWILLTRGQDFQVREHIMAVIENIPEKAPFKEEI